MLGLLKFVCQLLTQSAPWPLPGIMRCISNMLILGLSFLVADYVYKAIDALPVTAHPMTQFATGVMALQVDKWTSCLIQLFSSFPITFFCELVFPPSI